MSVKTQHILPPPTIPSHGTYTGDCLAASKLLMAVVAFAQILMDMEVLGAQFVVVLANLQLEIQNLLPSEIEKLRKQYDMDQIEKDIKNGKVTDAEKSEMQEYTTAVNVTQSVIQAGVKSIDPTQSTTQSTVTGIGTSMTEFLQEAGTVNQGQQALANDRIG